MSEPKTYSEIARRCRNLAAHGTSPAYVATIRAEWTQAVERRYARIRRLAKSVPVHNEPELHALLGAVAKAHGQDPELVRGLRRYRRLSPARRSFAWAACQAGFALTEVAMFMRRAGSHSTIIFLRDNASIDEQLIGQVAIDFVRSNTERTEQTQTEAA